MKTCWVFQFVWIYFLHKTVLPKQPLLPDSNKSLSSLLYNDEVSDFSLWGYLICIFCF